MPNRSSLARSSSSSSTSLIPTLYDCILLHLLGHELLLEFSTLSSDPVAREVLDTDRACILTSSHCQMKRKSIHLWVVHVQVLIDVARRD